MNRRAWIGFSAALLGLLAALFALRGSSGSEDLAERLSDVYASPQAPERPPMPPALRARVDEAGAHLTAGRFGEALRLYEGARESARDHPSALPEILTRLGLTAKKLGDYHRSLSFYTRALELARQAGDRHYVGKILHNIGTCYMALGEPRLALDALEDAFEARLTPWDRAVTLTAVATLNDLEGDHYLAVVQLREAFLLRRASLDLPAGRRQRGMATTLDRLGTAAKNAGRLQAARRAYESSRALLRDSPYVTELAIVEANLGRLLIEGGDPDAALPLLQQARTVLAGSGRRQDDAITLLGMARAYRLRGESARARRAVEQAIEIVENLREAAPGPHLRSSFLASHHVFYETAINLAMAQHAEDPAAGHALRALELAERAKARSLLDLLLEDPRSRRLARESELRDRVRPLEDALNRLEHRRLTLLHRGAPSGSLAEVEKAQRALIMESQDAWNDPPARERPVPSIATPDARRMRLLLDPDTRFLVYSLGDEDSFLWLVAAGEVVAHRLPPRVEIESTVRRAHEALVLSDQPGGRDKIPEAVLGALLLPRELGPLDNLRLVVVPDGILRTIPFAALPDPRTGRPLVHDHAILTLPSISALAVLRRRGAEREPAPRQLAVMADPVYSAGDPRLRSPEDPLREAPKLERLRFSGREAEAILDLVPEPSRLGLSGLDARREAVLDGLLEPFRIIHLSVHGELAPDRPELTSLVFSQVDRRGRPRDGRLFMHEIGSLSLPCELIVLSACNSALGKSIRGEGLIGLTRAVFLAGANRALVSLWYVDDRATAELMILFYRALLVDGLGPAEALRRAQLELPTVDRRWQAPYYWAGFVLQGDWHWGAGSSGRW